MAIRIVGVDLPRRLQMQVTTRLLKLFRLFLRTHLQFVFTTVARSLVVQRVISVSSVSLVFSSERNKDGVPAVVKTIEYDPNRTARIALLFYADGEKRYILAPNGLKVGANIMSGSNALPEVGNSLPRSCLQRS